MYEPSFIEQTDDDPKYPYKVCTPTDRQQSWESFVCWFNKQVEDRKIVTTEQCERFVEAKAKGFGFDVECSFRNGTVKIEVLPPKPVTCQLTVIPHELSTDRQKYERMREQLVEKYGRDLGTFCANRFASMIRKYRIEYITNLVVYRHGNDNDLVKLEAVRKDHPYGWREKTFEFKQRTVPHSATSRDFKTIKVTLCIAVGD